MKIGKIEFAELEKEISETGESPSEYLAPDLGKVYVIAIARDGCSACEKQKPKLNKLATELAQKFEDKVVFTQIHIKHLHSSDKESLRSKDIFGHYFYPTNLILIRTRDRGAIELYRNISPDMDELKKNIVVAAEIAAIIEKEIT